jgi:hypothetical protein
MERQDAAFSMLSHAPCLVLVLACLVLACLVLATSSLRVISSSFLNFLYLVPLLPLPRFSTIARSSGKSVRNLAHYGKLDAQGNGKLDSQGNLIRNRNA